MPPSLILLCPSDYSPVARHRHARAPFSDPQVWITGSSGSTIQAANITDPRLFTISRGAPRVHISNLRLLGTLSVHDAHLNIADCIIEAIPGQEHTSDSAQERALSVVGGDVTVTNTLVMGHPAGALSVEAAALNLRGCTLRDCSAPLGGAILVRGGAIVTASGSKLIGNRATVRGGAIQVTFTHVFAAHESSLQQSALKLTTASSHRQQVDSGNVMLANRTLLESNSAPDGGGSSISLSPDGTLQYTLPAPAGRWLNIRQGLTFQLDPGSEELDFPFACSPGVIGGALPEEQTGPGCSKPW